MGLEDEKSTLEGQRGPFKALDERDSSHGDMSGHRILDEYGDDQNDENYPFSGIEERNSSHGQMSGHSILSEEREDYEL